jgi:hypothetical protein
MRTLRATILVTLFTGLALAACGGGSDVVSKGAEKAVEDATGCDIDANGDEAKFECENEDGKGSFSVGSNTELPDDFPERDVPLPEGEVISAVSTENDGKQGFNVTVKIDGSLSSAAEDYRTELEDAGFTVDTDSSFSLGSGDAGITAFEAEGSTWDVNVIGSGGGGSNGKTNGLNITVTEHEVS